MLVIKSNFPIVRLSLFNKNILPGSAVKTLNGEDLSEIEDEDIIKLNQSTKKAELEIVGEANIVTVAGSIYNYMSYDLNKFEINNQDNLNKYHQYVDSTHTTSHPKISIKDSG